MKTISTKYVGPGNVKGARISAFDGDNRMSFSFRDEFSFEQNCMNAAKRFCAKLDWHGVLQGGHTKEGMVFVFTDDAYRLEV